MAWTPIEDSGIEFSFTAAPDGTGTPPELVGSVATAYNDPGPWDYWGWIVMFDNSAPRDPVHLRITCTAFDTDFADTNWVSFRWGNAGIGWNYQSYEGDPAEDAWTPSVFEATIEFDGSGTPRSFEHWLNNEFNQQLSDSFLIEVDGGGGGGSCFWQALVGPIDQVCGGGGDPAGDWVDMMPGAEWTGISIIGTGEPTELPFHTDGPQDFCFIYSVHDEPLGYATTVRFAGTFSTSDPAVEGQTLYLDFNYGALGELYQSLGTAVVIDGEAEISGEFVLEEPSTGDDYFEIRLRIEDVAGMTDLTFNVTQYELFVT